MAAAAAPADPTTLDAAPDAASYAPEAAPEAASYELDAASYAPEAASYAWEAAPDAEKASLRNRLGYLLIGNQWLTRADLEQWRDFNQRALDSLKRWGGNLEKIPRQLEAERQHRWKERAEPLRVECQHGGDLGSGRRRGGG